MRAMTISEFDEPEDRVAALENKVQEMNVLVERLLAEMLDFRALAMTMARESGERGRQEIIRGPKVQETAPPASAAPSESPADAEPSGDRIVIQSRCAVPSPVPSAPAESDMVRIMQSDGTMKLEPRRGGTKTIDSSAGYGQTRKGMSAGNKPASRK